MVCNKTHDNDIIGMGMIPRWNGKILRHYVIMTSLV